MSDVIEQVIQRHPEVKNEGIPEILALFSPFRFFNFVSDPKKPLSKAAAATGLPKWRDSW